MIKVSLKTHNGHYLIANDSRTNYRIDTTSAGVGSWEVFTIIPTDGRNADSIRSGDQIHIQTNHGRYVMARDGGGGAVSGEATLPSIWETFTIEKRGGGEIVHGDRVTFRANNGRNFLMARDGGGGDVTAESLNRLEWETFAVEFWNSMPVHLRAHDSHYVTAEDGGGRGVAATQSSADIWETFVLVNRSRKSGLRDGDKVCLQVWDGRFVSAEGGGGGNLPASRYRAAGSEIFTIKKVGGGEISLSDSVSFLAQNGVNYIMAVNGGGGIVRVSSRQAREWETFRISRVRRSIPEVYSVHRALLGSLNGPEVLLSGGRGRYQLCASGIIIEDPVWGAFELHGENYRKFLDLSLVRPGAGGFLEDQLRLLGYPRSEVRALDDRHGFSNYFERGLVVCRPDPDPVAAAIYGDFYEAWRRAAALGYPRLDRLPMRDGRGTYQLCDNGTIYHTATTGVHAIYGDVWRLWETWVKDLDHDPDRSRPEFQDPLYHPSPSSLLGNPALGYPLAEEQDAPEGRRIQQFEFGSITWRLTQTPPLRFFAQNMALLVFPGTYLGTERDRAIQALINHVRANQYDVVGLSECFADGERKRIWNALRDIYPHAPLEGPDEADIESDGGLLLMSRYPIIERQQTIYRQTVGDDSFANKGVLHARLQIPGLAAGFDVFLSHTQNPDATPPGNALRALKKQWAHLSAFVRAYSGPERPAILMGDLNTDAFDAALRDEFRRRLNFPQDLWMTSGDGSAGVTIDRKRSFHSGSPRLAVNDPERYRNGDRVDYMLSWPGVRYAPQFRRTQVLHLQSSVGADGLGRDLSDHYGLSAEAVETREFTVDVRRPITQVRVELIGFRCLEESDELGSDTPYFTLELATGNGVNRSLTTAKVSAVDTGDQHTYSAQVLEVPDPGAYLTLTITGMEYDWGSNDDFLGLRQLELSRNELLLLWSGASSRVLPLLTGDGSEYAVTVRITVS